MKLQKDLELLLHVLVRQDFINDCTTTEENDYTVTYLISSNSTDDDYTYLEIVLDKIEGRIQSIQKIVDIYTYEE